MTPLIAAKLARLQAENPGKPYSELCAMLARRPRRKVVTQNKVDYWDNKD